MLSVATGLFFGSVKMCICCHYIDGLLVLTAPHPHPPLQGGSAANGPVHHREHSLLNCPKTLLHTRVWVPLLDCIESVMYKEHPRATSITCQCCAEHVQTFTQAVYQ